MTIKTNTITEYTASSGVTIDKPVFIGGLTPSGDKSGVCSGVAATNPLADGGAHGFRDEGTYVSSGATGGYASYDAIATMGGTLNPNGHLYNFQARNTFTPSGAGELDTYTSFVTVPVINGPVANLYGLRMLDPTGAGVIDLQAVVYLGETLTRATANYFLYSYGTTPSYHGGFFQTGAGITAAGAIAGSNFYTNSDYNQAAFGIGTPGSSKIGYYLAAFGHNALGKITTGEALFNTAVGSSAGAEVTTGDDNTMIGAYAGSGLTTGSGHTLIGKYAGSTETTGNNKLYIANGNTTTPIIYGIMDNATWGNQEIKFNVGKMGFFGHAAAAQPTKAGHNNWAALSDVVSALVAIGILDTA